MLWNPSLTLNRLFLRIAFLGTAALIIISALLVQHEQQKAARQWQSDTISKSASLTSSYYSTLNTKLLTGNDKDVDGLLRELEKEENLISASIISPEQLNRSTLETCNIDYTHAYFLQVPTCHETTGETLKVYHELRSIGYSIGYLVKEIKIPPLRFWNISSIIWHIGCVLIVFLFAMTLVLFYIKIHLIQPLNNIGEALKNHKQLPDNDLHLKVDELQVIYESLKHSVQSIAEYERKIQKYTYDTKIGEMTTQVAHDIRSPLSSLKAASEMLRKHVAGSREAMDALNLLQLSGQRLEGIANGLLIRHKWVTSASQVFSIHEVLDELVGEMQASPLGNGVQFTKHYNSGALYVSGDKTGITRALGNIIKNALEAMDGNSGSRSKQLIVATTCNPKHSEGSHNADSSPLAQDNNVVIRITDTGSGIAVDKIPLILDGGHTEGKADGHGIGTRVVRAVIDTHKGTLNVESEVGVGTTFMITLPTAAPVEDAATGTTVTIPYSGSGTIHVIDDEPSMREQWRLTLKSHGVATETYQSWEEYEGIMRPLTPAISTFIIDYHFDNSEVDGLEIIRRLKGRGFSMFVLATAEYWKPAIKAAAVELGITICPKPLPKVMVQASSPPQSASIVNGGPAVTPITESPLTLNPNAGMTNLEMAKEAGPSVLLIDDDSSIHLSWKLMRKTLGVGKLVMHSNLEEMIAAATNPAQFDLCVIDKNIEGSQFDGARTLDYLRQNGARSIVLATCETEDDIRNDPRFNSADGILRSKVPMSSDELDCFLS